MNSSEKRSEADRRLVEESNTSVGVIDHIDDNRPTEDSTDRHTDLSDDDSAILSFVQNHLFAVSMIIIGVISFLLRLFRIMFKDGGSPVFDEKHYAVHAQEMIQNGGWENNPNYALISHPPLGKWLIAFGEMIFGYNPMGWRFTSILAGVATVLIACWMVHFFTKNIALVYLSATILNVEGISLSMSRMGMLDSFLGLFAVAITACGVKYVSTQYNKVPIHNSYWLFVMGVLGGMMMSIKISGVYYMAAAGVILVVGTLIHSENIRKTISTAAVGLIYFLVIPVVVFFLTYIPWFSNESSVFRHAIESGDHAPVEGTEFLPLSIQNFIRLYTDILSFHTTLSTSPENFHPYESKAWEWFVAARPLLTLSESQKGEDTSMRMYIVANPTVWYLLGFVMILAIVMTLHKKSAKWSVVAVGLALGILPWMIFIDRQQYIFYLTTVAPFLAMGITFVVDDLATMFSKSARVVTDRSIPGYTIYRKKGLLNSHGRSVAVLGSICAVIFTAGFIMIAPWVYGIEMSIDYHQSIIDFFPRWEAITDLNITEMFDVNETITETVTETVVVE